jgi:RNA polymerase sigma-70 factor (ECF subfamily)
MSAATVAAPDVRGADQVSDEALLARIAGGDQDALGELYRRYRGTVRGYMLGRIARPDDADDVVQETFLRAGREAGDYRAEHGYRVPAWLCWQAGAQLREYGRRDLHPYLAAARAAREDLRRPVTETAEHREATPLSEPVQAALRKLTPGERRAIQLRYLDGLTPDQAAEIAGVRERSFHRRVAYGRHKLVKELADLAPAARSPLQEMPRPEAYTLALSKADNNVPAATAWLQRHGIRTSDDTLYRHRHHLQTGTTTPVERPRPERAVLQPARPAYTPPEHITALTNARDRARAAALDYHTRFGHLPTRREVMTATGVSGSTAIRALRPLKTEPTTAAPAEVSSPSLTPTSLFHKPDPALPLANSEDSGEGDSVGQRPIGRQSSSESFTLSARSELTPFMKQAPTRQTGDSRGERTVVAEPSHIDRRSDITIRDRSGDVIEQARTAVAVLAANRRLREQQRRENEQARVEQLNRWHNDDAQQAAARAREEWGLAR